MNVIQRNNVQVLGDSGPVLLYAHGFGCNKNMWAKVTPAFAATHRQVVFDYVGSGQSDLASFDSQRYSSLNGYAKDVLDVCDALGLTEGVTFVGHSVSCSVGILASIARPKLFDRMVLIGPSPCFVNHPPEYLGGFEREDLEGLLSLMDQNYIGWANYLAPVVSGADADADADADAQDAVSAELSDSFCSTDPVVAKVFAKTTFFSDNRSDLPKVTVPCLVIQHRNDALAPIAVGEYVHTHLKGSNFKILEVPGHCSHMSHPDLVAETMKDYLGDTVSA